MIFIQSLAEQLLNGLSQAFMRFVQAQAPGLQQDPRAQLLAQLHDVKTPGAISGWPPAPGWYIVAILLFALIAFGVYQAVSRIKKRRYRKIALTALENIRHQLYHSKALTSQEAVRECMQLVKRTFFSAYPGSRRHIAGLEGSAWIQLLKDTCKNPIPEQNLSFEIQRAMYHPNQKAVDNETIFIFCDLWIKQHLDDSAHIRETILNAAKQHLAYRESHNPRVSHV